MHAYHLHVLDAAPHSFNEDLTDTAAPATYADLDAFALKNTGKFTASKLISLTRVEDFQSAVLSQSIFQRIYAEAGVEGVGYSLGQGFV